MGSWMRPALTKLMASVEASKLDVSEFAFRRRPDGTAVTANATKESIFEDLKSPIEFLGAFAQSKTTLLFSLQKPFPTITDCLNGQPTKERR